MELSDDELEKVAGGRKKYFDDRGEDDDEYEYPFQDYEDYFHK